MYSATVGSIKRALTEGVTLGLISRATTGNPVYEEIYKTMMDLTQLNYVCVGLDVSGGGGGGITKVKIEQAGIILDTITSPVGASMTYFNRIALNANTRVLGMFKISMQSSSMTGQITDCQIFGAV
jgi:hypothetical protein